MPNPGFATCGVIMGWVGAFWGGGERIGRCFRGQGVRLFGRVGVGWDWVGRAVVDREVIADAGL